MNDKSMEERVREAPVAADEVTVVERQTPEGRRYFPCVVMSDDSPSPFVHGGYELYRDACVEAQKLRVMFGLEPKHWPRWRSR
jgi:hypothetical protein